jgi:hypothetical protein
MLLRKLPLRLVVVEATAVATPVAVAEEPSAEVVEDETPAAPATEESSEEEKKSAE